MKCYNNNLLSIFIVHGSVLHVNITDDGTYAYHDGDVVNVYGKYCVKIVGQIEDINDQSTVVFSWNKLKEHIDYCNSLIEQNNDILLKLKK